MTTGFSQTAAYIWSLADLLRGDFKQSQYGRVILPFTMLRRLECVLEDRKPAVLEQVEKLNKSMTTLQFPWFWKDGKFSGERVNDFHLTNVEKRTAREQGGGR